MKVAVLGAGGIIGQHLMLSVPRGVEARFVRKTPSPICESVDLENWTDAEAWLNDFGPDVIVNLAGESRVDVVENGGSLDLNAVLPVRLARWCHFHNAHLIQTGTQADETNRYGRQKMATQNAMYESNLSCWTIAKPTFVLGIRPFPAIGRENPAESILSGKQGLQVCDRWFSVSFAWDVAEKLWELCETRPQCEIVRIGNPERLSRYDLARMLNPSVEFEPVEHDSFSGLAPRPIDTTYIDAHFVTELKDGIECLRWDYLNRAEDNRGHRAREIAAFLKIDEAEATGKLITGFLPLHHAVAEDFRRKNPKSETELLDWYRSTEAYIWELTAYHCDPGFNYAGMCKGIIDALKAKGCKRVLNLGDGVGTMTIAMTDAGLDAHYHDAASSKTSSFAAFRIFARQESLPFWLTPTYSPTEMGRMGGFDAITSMDFLEHVPNVEQWVCAVWDSLKPGGYFIAQNAFNCGSGPDGSIPMHLDCNDHLEKDWDPLLASIGFVSIASNWYQKPL